MEYVAQNSGVIFSGRGNCTSYSKLHKLVGQIATMQSRVWWWQPEALGAGETEKGSSMDAVGECPEWGQPADSNSPRSIHHFLVWIWARGNFVNMRYLKWKLDSPTPMHCDQPSFTWKFAVWHFGVRSFCIEQLEGFEEPSGAIKGLDKRIATYDMHKGYRAQLYS